MTATNPYPVQVRQDHITGFWYVIDSDGHCRPDLFFTQAGARASLAPPMDPDSLDASRPVDLDLCPVCDGLGGYTVASHDPYDDAGDGVECWACGGTGQRGAA